MPEFFYKALTGSGAVAEGWMQAPNEGVVEEDTARQESGGVRAGAEERPQLVGHERQSVESGHALRDADAEALP